MGELQRTHHVFQLTATTGGIDTVTQRVLSGRARQLIRLHRYWGEIQGTPASATLETVEALVIITTGELRIGAGTPPILSSADLETLQAMRSQEVIDLWPFAFSIIGTSGVRTIPQQRWDKETNLLVPAIHVGVIFEPTGATEQLGITFHVEYEWVDADIAMIAAVNLVWGRDPQDFDLPGTSG